MNVDQISSFATEEEARRVETALDGRVLPNHHDRLRVNKARVSRFDSRRYPQHDRHSGSFQGSRAYPSNQFRNHSVPDERAEICSQTFNAPTWSQPLAEMSSLPQTPKARYQHSEPSSESINFNGGTIRRKKPSRTSVKPIAEESLAAQYDCMNEPTKPESDKPTSISQADEAGTQKHTKVQTKGAKHSRKTQPAAGLALKVSEQVSVTPSGHTEHSEAQSTVHKPQYGTHYSNKGRFDEPRTRPLSLGDFMHTSALENSPERSSDQSEQKPNDGSPTRKPKNQSGSIRSKPRPRKESFPALDSKRGMSSTKAQGIIESTSSDPIVGHSKLDHAESKIRDYPTTPRMEEKLIETILPIEYPEQLRAGAQIADTTVDTFEHSAPPSDGIDQSLQIGQPTEDRSTTDKQHARPTTPVKPLNGLVINAECSTSANSAVSALVSESWANELTSPEDLDVKSAEAASKVSKRDPPSLELNFSQKSESKVVQMTNLNSSVKAAEDLKMFSDETVVSAAAIEEANLSPKSAVGNHPFIAMAKESETNIPKTIPLSGTDGITSAVHPGSKAKFHHTVPPRKHHLHEMSRGETSIGDSTDLPTHQIQSKLKQNKKKKISNNATSDGYLDTRSANEADKGVESSETMASVPTSAAVTKTLIETPPLPSPRTTAATGSPIIKARDEPAQLFEIQTPLPHSDESRCMTELPESLGISEGALLEPATKVTLKSSNVNVPPRTSSIVSTTEAISTHKRKQKTPTKEVGKKTKKQKSKKSSMATKTEVELVAKSGNVVETITPNEPGTGWQEPESQPEAGTEVSHLKDPEHEEVVDISDQCTRRPEYPSLDPTNAVYCVRGPTVIKRSDFPFLVYLIPNNVSGQADEEDQANTLKPTKDKVDMARRNDFAQPTSDAEKGGRPKGNANEENLSDLGTPQLTSHRHSALPSKTKSDAQANPTITSDPQTGFTNPKDEPNARSQHKKSKKKPNKKKKKAKTEAVIDKKAEPSAPAGLEENLAVPEVDLPPKQSAELFTEDIFSKSDRFVADPEAYAQEIFSTTQGLERPAPKTNGQVSYNEQARQYYIKKEQMYEGELAKMQESLGMNPYSPDRYRRSGSNPFEREDDSHSIPGRPIITTERKIELLNTPTFSQSDKIFHGLGITTSSSADQEPPKSMLNREMVTHKGMECDKSSNPPLIPFTSVAPRRPMSTTSEIIKTPSDSTSPETVIADGQGIGMTILKPNHGESRDKSPTVKAFVAKLDAIENEMAALTTSPQLSTIAKEHLSEDHLKAMAQVCDSGPGVLGLSAMLGKMALAERVEKSKIPSFPASRLEEDKITGDATRAKFGAVDEARGNSAKDQVLKRDELRNAGGSDDKKKFSKLFVSELENDAHPESLFFSDERVVPKSEEKSFGALATPPSEEDDVDAPKPSSAYPTASIKTKHNQDSKDATVNIPQYGHANGTPERLSKDVVSVESLATFVSEINFEIDPSDPIVHHLTHLDKLQPLSSEPMPSEDANAKASLVEDRLLAKAQQDDALAADSIDRMRPSENDGYSGGLGREESLVQDYMSDMTGRATRASSDFSDIIDANIFNALRSLPDGSPEGTVVKVVSQCMERDSSEEETVSRKAGSTSIAAGASSSESMSSQAMDTRPKQPLKKRSKKALGKSLKVEGSTPSAWVHFAANVEKDEAAQRESRRQEQEKRKAEDEKGGVAIRELNLEAMSQTWCKVETGETGHRRLGESLTTVSEVSILDMPESDLDIRHAETAIIKSESDRTPNESSTPTSEDDSEVTLKPSRSPDPPFEPLFEASIDAVLANSTLDTIPESAEFTKSKTPSGSPNRVAALRPSPITRPVTGKSTITSLNTFFPALPPPSVFALSNPSSPVRELSEDVIAMHNNIGATPQRRHRGSSSVHSEYSTTSSTPNTNVLSNSARRSLPQPKEPSWSNIAASSGNSNVRLSPSRNPSTAMSPAQNPSTRLSPSRRFARSRADTRSSLAQSITSRESEEEDMPRRGRSTTPAGGQKGVVRRQGTAPKRGKDGDEWSVPPGEKMWGSSSEA